MPSQFGLRVEMFPPPPPILLVTVLTGNCSTPSYKSPVKECSYRGEHTKFGGFRACARLLQKAHATRQREREEEAQKADAADGSLLLGMFPFILTAPY